ncbi:ArfGap-domain-containing protein [Hesseltinella vesiculosa]|uniref:ArfGap-domain-containing protein n=1 Tax=Hesseltinella vesiculosa TaxID=101127 RepID=A0A1X2GRR1_9FUNG|nr:ArfGap-domain-containing protein [Hesseltinella vesiculosa]
MSTRFTRTADKAQSEKNATTLKSLLQVQGNKYCADCGRKDPRWASWNLGIFVCIRCSGIHRSLGTHISKVKSVDLDSWTPDQIENMRIWGNERANLYWEANVKNHRPNENNMELWIRSKYEMKRFALKGPMPDPSQLGTPSSSSQEPAPAKPPQREESTPKAAPKKEFNSLDDFFGSSSPAAAPVSNTASQLQGADFFSSPTNTAPPTQQQPQPKQPDFKSSILSLYNQPPPQMAPSNNGFASAFQQPTAFQQQPPMDQSWGSFVTNSAPARSPPAAIQGSQFFGQPANPITTAKPTHDFIAYQPFPSAFADLLGGYSSSSASKTNTASPAPKKLGNDAIADLLG